MQHPSNDFAICAPNRFRLIYPRVYIIMCSTDLPNEQKWCFQNDDRSTITGIKKKYILFTGLRKSRNQKRKKKKITWKSKYTHIATINNATQISKINDILRFMRFLARTPESYADVLNCIPNMCLCVRPHIF